MDKVPEAKHRQRAADAGRHPNSEEPHAVSAFTG